MAGLDHWTSQAQTAGHRPSHVETDVLARNDQMFDRGLTTPTGRRGDGFVSFADYPREAENLAGPRLFEPSSARRRIDPVDRSEGRRP